MSRLRPHRLVVRTPPFHGGNRGSSSRGVNAFRHAKESVLDLLRLCLVFLAPLA